MKVTAKQQQRRNELEMALLFLAAQRRECIYENTIKGVRRTGRAAIGLVMDRKGDVWVRRALKKPMIVKALAEADTLFKHFAKLRTSQSKS